MRRRRRPRASDDVEIVAPIPFLKNKMTARTRRQLIQPYAVAL